MKKFISSRFNIIAFNLLFLNLATPINLYASGETGIVHIQATENTRYPEALPNFTYNNTGKLKVDVHFRNFKECDQKKVNQAVIILEQVMNSQEFKDRVLNFTFKGEKRFHQNNDMTNQQIYDHLMSGEEVLIPGADGVMNFDLTLYRSWNPFSKVKGYTLPDTIRIWIHKKFFRRSSWTSVDVA